jgi:hypothetical protein
MFSDVSEESTASIFNVEENVLQQLKSKEKGETATSFLEPFQDLMMV